MPRERSLGELGEDLDEIKAQITALFSQIQQGYVPRELYEARHTNLRSEIALEFASMKRELESVKSVATGARTLAMWCLGTLAAGVMAALVGFLATGGAA